VEETSIASITDLNSIFKKWEPRLILIKAVDTAHLNSMPANWEYLLQYHHLTDPKALKAVTATLDNMAFGGL
jgi:hypothetical protein